MTLRNLDFQFQKHNESKFGFYLRFKQNVFHHNWTNNLWVFCWILFCFCWISIIKIFKHFHIKYVTNIRSQTGLNGGELCLCYITGKRRCESEQAQTYDVSRITTCLETLLQQFSSNMLQSYMKYKSGIVFNLILGFFLKGYLLTLRYKSV